ncbi:hypothetical protein [Microbacterium hatanonis]|uniref:FtsX-like permease family protein n=1 Tax=Microbacterium hatanonis TaxID=404366 RepID=A0A5C8I3K8_9MICO|nr:hypothetical protein [Microbacterium hatanonis]TXK13668.1 hypothetical protein FVP77_09935 [Microbacterium hatanonis]
MHFASLLPRRALEAAAGAVIAVAAFLAVLLPLQVSAAVDDLARATVAAGGTVDVTLTIELPVDDPAGAQDAAVRSAIDSSLGADGAGVVLDVSRTEPDAGFARWTIAPRADVVTAADLEAVPAAWRRMRPALVDAGVDASQVAFSGSLVPTALTVTRQSDALRGAAPIALAAAATVAFVAVNEIARLLAIRGARRSALLWSRGARLRRLIGDATLPSAVAVVLGAAVGAVTGAAVAGRLPLDAAGWAVAAGATAVVPVALALIAGHAFAGVRRLERPDTAESPRSRRALRVVAVSLLVALAGFTSWQLLLFGTSPLSTDAARTNPAILLAPAASLAAVSIVAILLVSQLGSPVDRVVGRRVTWFSAVWLRGAFRRGAVSITPLLLCALAVGQLVVVAGYGASWTARYDAVAAARWGTEVRMDAGSGDLDAEVLAAAGSLEEVSRVAPIRTTGQSLAAQSVSVLAVTAPAVAELAEAPAEERRRWAEVIAPEVLPGWAVAAGAAVELSLSGSGATPGTTVSVVFGNADGVVVRVGGTDDVGGGTVTLAAPPGATEWRLVAIDVASTPPADERGAPTVAVEVNANGERLDPAGWLVASPFSEPYPLDTGRDSGLEAAILDGAPFVRFLAGTDADPLPVVVTTAFLDATGLSLGERFSLTLWGLDTTAVEVAAVTPAIPGADSAVAVMIDAWAPILGALAWNDDTPSPSVAWVGSAGAPASTAAALRSIVPEGVRVDGTAVDPARDILAAAPLAMWWGAGAAALLALLGTAAVSLAGRDADAAEADALRLIGLGPRLRRAARGAERVAVVAVGLVVGMLAGVVVLALLVPSLARGAAPSESLGLAPPVVDAVAGGASAAAFVAALALVLAIVVWREPRAPRPGSRS